MIDINNMDYNAFGQLTDETRQAVISHLEEQLNELQKNDGMKDEAIQQLAVGLDIVLQGLGAEGHFFT